MSWIAAAVIGGAVVSTIGGAIAAGNASHAAITAANTQSDAAKYAADVQRDIYNGNVARLQPFVNAGAGAIPQIQSLLPGYRLAQGGAGSPGVGIPTPGQGGGQGPVLNGGVNSNTGTGVIPTDENGVPIGSGPNDLRSTLPQQVDANGMPIASGPQNINADGTPDTGPGPVAPGKALTDLESFGPGGSDPSVAAVNNLLPGGSDQSRKILDSLTPGGGNPLLDSVYSFVPGLAGNSKAAGVTEAPALTALNNLLGLSGRAGGGTPDPDAIQKALEATPGYQFTRDQGLKATQNGFAAKGLANSGAALKGAAQFTTGLANQTYEQRLNDYLQNYQTQANTSLNTYNTQFTNALNNYNSTFSNSLNARNTGFQNADTVYNQQLTAGTNLLTLGSNAAAQVGTQGVATGGNIGNNITSAGAATAAGIVGSTNSTNNAIINGTNAVSGATNTLALLNSGFVPGTDPNYLKSVAGMFE